MTVSALIKTLEKLDPDAVVLTYDADTENMEEVTGVIYGGDKATVELQTDTLDD